VPWQHERVTFRLRKGKVRRFGATLLAAVAVSSCSAPTQAAHPSAPPPVTSRTSFDGEFYFTPRPGPASATSLSASAAWRVMARGKPIPTFETAQYGVLTDKVSHLTHDAKRVTRYRYRDRPVWAFSTRGLCPPPDGLGNAGANTPPPPHPCVAWRFLDASTGDVLAMPIQDVRTPGG
jgi:hypothetical protein